MNAPLISTWCWRYQIHCLLCIIVVRFFLYCLYMEILQKPKILPLLMLCRTSLWTGLDGTNPITDLIFMKIQQCALWSFGGCVFREAHKGLSSLQNKTINFLKKWGWSKKCFQDHILGAGLLNFAWNPPWAPQALLITDPLNDCMEKCWKADTECLYQAFIYFRVCTKKIIPSFTCIFCIVDLSCLSACFFSLCDTMIQWIQRQDISSEL